MSANVKAKPIGGKLKLKMEWRDKILSAGGSCAACRTKFTSTRRPVYLLYFLIQLKYINIPLFSTNARSALQLYAVGVAKVFDFHFLQKSCLY